MSRLREIRTLHRQIVGQNHWPDRSRTDPELISVYDLCWRIADNQARYAFEGIERKRSNWHVIYSCGKNRYRWQMPDEATARAVETYGKQGGGLSFARRKAVRSYKWCADTERWKTLNIKTSKKWKAKSAERSRMKRLKSRARAKAKARALAVQQNLDLHESLALQNLKLKEEEIS